jgi:hypothetical protein
MGSGQTEATSKCKTERLEMVWLVSRENGITDIRWQKNCATVAFPN